VASYRRKSFLVEAVEVDVEKFVETADGPRWAQQGDWVVTESNGTVNVCPAWSFGLKFEKVDDPPDGRDGKTPIADPAPPGAGRRR
jgi:hypothetical protein